MFSRNREAIAAAVHGAAQPAGRWMAQPGMAPSIISADIAIIGLLTTAGEIQVEGRVDGDVRCDSLVIGATGRIYGEILASKVTIRGHFKGLIQARTVHLCPGSGTQGEILYQTLVVEAGADFAGHCRQCDDPLAEAKSPVAFPHDAVRPLAAAAE